MSKIRKSARGEDCALRIPGVCNFDPETTVLAHAPCRDKGMGFKSADWWASYACSSCHDFIDGRAGPNNAPLTCTPGLYWLGGIYETQKKLREKGLIK